MITSPADCTSLADVRQAIDALDHQLITLLGQRLAYVRVAAQFKTSAATVRAPDRVHAMLQQRRAWAVEHGLDPDVIEQMYHALIEYFIADEQRHWQADQTNTPT